jgi:hypothetical protein
MTSYWKELVIKYADGRPICNCGEAYYTPYGVGIDKHGNHRTDMLACAGGCSCNQITAREEIAKKILNETFCSQKVED